MRSVLFETVHEKGLALEAKGKSLDNNRLSACDIYFCIDDAQNIIVRCSKNSVWHALEYDVAVALEKISIDPDHCHDN